MVTKKGQNDGQFQKHNTYLQSCHVPSLAHVGLHSPL